MSAEVSLGVRANNRVRNLSQHINCSTGSIHRNVSHAGRRTAGGSPRRAQHRHMASAEYARRPRRRSVSDFWPADHFVGRAAIPGFRRRHWKPAAIQESFSEVTRLATDLAWHRFGDWEQKKRCGSGPLSEKPALCGGGRSSAGS